jgi:hypothetical protein
MLTKILSNKSLHLIGFILFYLLLIYEYFFFVFPYFEDKGFILQLSIEKIAIGVILFSILTIRIFYLKQPSGFIYVLSIFAGMSFCIPSVIMYQFAGTSVLIPILSVFFILVLSTKYLSFPKIKSVNLKFSEQKYILLGITILLIIPFFITYGFTINKDVFSFGSEIYDIRADAKLHSNVLTSYFFGQLTKVLLPALIVYGLLRNNRLLWITGIALMLYIFMINPHKSVFMSIFVILAFYFFKDFYTKAGLMIGGIIGLLVLTIIFTTLTGNILPESIFVRRMFFLPVYISDHYFTFFHDNHVLLSHSILSPFFDYPYDLDPALLMGNHIYDNPLTSCNTGIIGDGFMNFGIIGSVVFALIAAVIFRYLESLNMHHSFFGISFLFLVLFLNSALFTILLTHGGIFFMIIGLFFFKNTDNISKK